MEVFIRSEYAWNTVSLDRTTASKPRRPTGRAISAAALMLAVEETLKFLNATAPFPADMSCFCRAKV